MLKFLVLGAKHFSSALQNNEGPATQCGFAGRLGLAPSRQGQPTSEHHLTAVNGEQLLPPRETREPKLISATEPVPKSPA